MLRNLMGALDTVPNLGRRRFIRDLAIGGTGLVMLLGCEEGTQLIDGEGTPAIEFSMVPTYEQTTRPFGVGHVRGSVSHVMPIDYKVALYISISGGAWWPKPYFDDPFTDISANGEWRNNFITGGQDDIARFFRAYLIPEYVSSPYKKQAGTGIPDVIQQNAVAMAEYDRGDNSSFR